MRRSWLAATLSLPLLAAAPAEPAEVITTPGSGALTKCRDWLVYMQCSTYHHIALPARIAVGDALDLTYGSNPKEYVFRVKRIRHRGDGCILFNEDSGSGEQAERLEITPCRPAAE